MRVIYEPGGRAREGASLALNLYSGCGHACIYCYAPAVLRKKRTEFVSHPAPRKEIVKRLEKDAARFKGDDREILLSFTSDPYQPIETELEITRSALKILIHHGLHFAILTKGGRRALRDFDLLEGYNRCRFGMSFSLLDEAETARWEPNATQVSERIEVLNEAHHRGIRTWACMEPVIDPEQILELIRFLHPVVNHWMEEPDKFENLFRFLHPVVNHWIIGKLNYRKLDHTVDWVDFRERARELLESLGTDYYLKKSLTGL